MKSDQINSMAEPNIAKMANPAPNVAKLDNQAPNIARMNNLPAKQLPAQLPEGGRQQTLGSQPNINTAKMDGNLSQQPHKPAAPVAKPNPVKLLPSSQQNFLQERKQQLPQQQIQQYRSAPQHPMMQQSIDFSRQLHSMAKRGKQYTPEFAALSASAEAHKKAMMEDQSFKEWQLAEQNNAAAMRESLNGYNKNQPRLISNRSFGQVFGE